MIQPSPSESCGSPKGTGVSHRPARIALLAGLRSLLPRNLIAAAIFFATAHQMSVWLGQGSGIYWIALLLTVCFMGISVLVCWMDKGY